jgi:hypothetical protein
MPNRQSEALPATRSWNPKVRPTVELARPKRKSATSRTRPKSSLKKIEHKAGEVSDEAKDSSHRK